MEARIEGQAAVPETTADSAKAAACTGHAVHFYEGDEYLTEVILRHLQAGFAAGEKVLVIATESHRRRLERALAGAGIGAAAEIAAGRLTLLDACQTLERFIRDRVPDRELFLASVGKMAGEMGAGGTRRVRAFGEMVAILWQQRNGEAAAQLEGLWNELGRQQPLALLCAYPMREFAREEDREFIERICALHSELIPASEFPECGPGHHAGVAALLQQRSLALEDAAQKRRAIEAEARQLLAAIVDSSDDAIISKSLDGIITSWNRGAARIFGYTAEETIGRPVQMLFPPERLSEEEAILEKLRRGERVDHFETVRMRKDGTRVDLSLTISPVRDSLGKLIGASKIARDITDRKQSHEALREREQFLRAIVETTPECIKIVAADGIVLEMNPAGLAMIGAHDAAEVKGKSVYDLMAPEDRAAYVAFNKRVCGGETASLCFDIIGLGGVRRSMESFSVPLCNPDGRSTVHLSLTHDVTEERHARQTLQRQNVRLKLLNEAAGHLLAAEAPDEMARGLFQRVRRELGVSALSVYVMDEPSGVLSLMAAEGFSDEAGETQEAAGRAIAGKVAASGRAVVAEKIQESDDPALASLKRRGFKAAVCEPLPAGHRLLGTLCFASSTREAFDEGDRQFIRTLCHYVSTAYERVRLMKELRAHDRRKDEFLATLAHELRNPLAPLCSTLELLRMGNIAQPIQEQLREMMQQQLRQLSRLVDDLMEVSRITSGKISLKREQVDLAEVIQNAIDMSRPQIEKLHHQLTVSLPRAAMIVDADPMRLAQVFVNLLNNAAKYTEERGQIAVTARREGGQAVISVRDSGLGIPREMLPQVFDMFAQIDRTLNRSQGGLGIGLSLARQLIELHGGRIEAHSEGAAMGSEFIVRLACVDVLGNAAMGPQQAAGRPAVRRRRVLVADDNREAALSLSLLLQTFGHTTRVAFDGKQALDMAEEFRPDAVVMDIGMPHLDGYATARRLRADPWGRRMLLVALSGWGQDEDRRQARDAGFDYHFTKPIDIDALISLLEDPRRGESEQDTGQVEAHTGAISRKPQVRARGIDRGTGESES